MPQLKRWLKTLILTLLALGLVALAGVMGFREAMKRAWVRYGEYDIRSEGSLSVGDLAPDLELARADGSGSVKLSEVFRERPVVLAFGSYT